MCQIIGVDVILLGHQLAKVTFVVFTCNRMVQLKKRGEIDCNSKVTNWKLKHLVNTPSPGKMPNFSVI